MEHTPLIIEREFNAPIDLVWRAITEKELMEKWYFNIADFELKVGHTFHFEGGEEDKRYLHRCEIVEIVPQQKLKYSWSYVGYPGISFVTFELTDLGEKTGLKLIHEGLESFDHPDFKRENFMGGWTYLIQESLPAFLDEGKGLRYW